MEGMKEPRLAFLTGVPFSDIARAFNEAFADYYLRMGAQAEVWLRNRMIKNAVDADCSVGAFDGGKLVGFSLTGIDLWDGAPAAFDAATGIVPEYRRRGLAAQMFEFARPRLAQRRVERFLLEVLQVNEPAIKAYRKAGFRITREFDCFELDMEEGSGPVGGPAGTAAPPAGIELRPMEKSALTALVDQMDWRPSWENSPASIARIPDEVLAYGAWEGTRLGGAIVYYPLLNWIVSLVVRRDLRRRGIGAALLSRLRTGLPEGTPRVRLVNVLHEDRVMSAFLEAQGFRPFTSQYEMELAPL